AFALGIALAAKFNLPVPLLAVLVLAAFAAACVLLLGKKPAAAALFFLFCFLGMLSAQQATLSLYAPLQPVFGRSGVFTGYVTEVLQVTEDKASFLFFAEEVQLSNKEVLPVRAQVRVQIYKPPAGFNPVYGLPLQLQGTVNKPMGQRNPGGFDYAQYLAARHVGGIMTVSPREVTVMTGQKGNVLVAFLARLRRRATTVFARHLPAAEAGLLAGMVLGQRDLVAAETIAAYRQLGLAHLLAVSGLHVGYVAAFVFYLTALFSGRSRSWPVYILTMFLIFLYVLLTGGQPPVWRAALMLMITMFARQTGRTGDGLQALCTSGMILLFSRPLWLFSLSFQFSFAATAGILLLTPRLQTYFSRLPPALANSLAVTLAAQAAVLPLQINHFGLFSLFVVPLNLFCIPLVGVVMILGLAGMLCGLVSLAAAAPLLWTALPLLTILDRVPRAFYGMPASALSLPPLPPVWWLVYLGFLFFFIQGARLQPLTGKKILVFLLAANLILFSGLPVTLERGLQVTFLDVGQGLAVYIRTPSNQHILIDAGTAQAGESVLVPFLRTQRLKSIDLMILTHPHDDHYGGMVPVLENFQVAAFAGNGLAEKTESYATLERLCQEQQIPCFIVKQGSVLTLGEVKIKVLWPPAGHIKNTGDDLNNNSLVMQVFYRDFSCLVTGDLEEAGLKSLLATQSGKLKADLVQIPHHGSRNTYLPQFLEAVAPQIAVIPVGPNLYGHPHTEVLTQIAQTGCSLYRTDRHGAVTVTGDGRILTHGSFLPEAEAETGKVAFFIY
ncbi:MAG: DNA internalization-related competence protein ComEC/Rec2, partial [Firmicutes bacterium]|nr:DNA internalization-related competence protein ComEC/Rec2 [Bacillota bacterium]